MTSRVTSTTSTTSSTAALQPSGKPRVVAPVIILLVLLLSYISSSAVILARLMGWTILQSFYFCFLSILTVGLGPAGDSQTNSLACSIYIFTGLILLSTAGQIFYSEVLTKIRQYGGGENSDKTEGELGSLARLMDRKRSSRAFS